MSIATLGVIVTNRNFFADSLVVEGRKTILNVLHSLDIEAVIVDEETTNLGAVETLADARKCAELFQANRKRIEGILVALPNFGDEKGVADAIRFAGLNVPIFIQAFPDTVEDLTYIARRDSFCGKLSVANNLYQYGIPYTVTENHTIDPQSEAFKKELLDFVGTCKVANGIRHARLGVIGARPNAFQTVRFSEKILDSYGINVSTADLSEIFGQARKLADDDPRVKDKLEQVTGYINASKAPHDRLVRMAKFGVVLADWVAANEVNATALQCWTSMQENFGINPCTLMSMMSESLMPSACETDILGTLSMYALTLASGKPSALVDWNNNYNDDPNRCLLFHCGNWPKSFFKESEMISAEILGSTLGAENTWGAISGRAMAGPMSFARLVTDDRKGVVKAVVGEGCFTDDYVSPVAGSHAVIEVPGLSKLLYHLAKEGFPHHGAVNPSHCAGVLAEAFRTYLGWEVYNPSVN